MTMQTPTPDSTPLNWAYFYRGLGWSVIPIRKETKKPACNWKEYQSRFATDDELNKWFKGKDVSQVGIGLVTGKLSGVVVIDDDSYKKNSAAPKLDSSLKSRTGRGGTHYFFQLHNNLHNTVNKNIAVDIRAEGGYVVLPPTIHPSGNAYTWHENANFNKVPTLPPGVLQAIIPTNHSANPGTNKEPFKIRDHINISEGSRNDSTYRLSCSLLNSMSEDDARHAAWEINRTYNPPLPEKEFNDTFNSAVQFIRSHPTKNETSHNYKPPTQQGEPLASKVITVGELVATDYPTVPWVVDRLIPKGTSIISGYAASYKTFFALEACFSIASGSKVFDHFSTQQANVLFIDLESGLPRLKDRSLMLAENFNGLPLSILSETIFTASEENINDLIKIVREKQIGLVIIDSLVRILGDRDENSSKDIAGLFSQLNRIRTEGTSLVVLHHHRKPNKGSNSSRGLEMRGSSDLLSVVDAQITLVRENNVITVTQNKCRDAEELPPFQIQAVSEAGNFRFNFLGEVRHLNKSKAEKAKDAVLHILGETESEIHTDEVKSQVSKILTDVNPDKINAALRALEKRGDIISRRGKPKEDEKEGKYYSPVKKADPL